MSHPAIRVCGLSKKFKVGAHPAKYNTLRDAVAKFTRSPWSRRQRSKGSASSSHQASETNFWALKEISFAVEAGQVVGVIGRNGAGKSTLLKILSRISDPTEGFVELYGRTGALLEVGTGFHPELTGRENIFLNGAILGMSRAETAKSFDEIVSFAEVERFIDTPVKHYSSGMYLRLAFAVAAQLEPEILLMDEVLAVGDAAFQKKCLGKMSSVARNGRTVLFVSHNMVAVKELCSRALWLDNGIIRADGTVEEIVKSYLQTMAGGGIQLVSESFGLTIHSVVLRDSVGQFVNQIGPGEDLNIEISYEARQPIRKPYFLIVVESTNGRCFTANMLLDGCQPQELSGRGSIACTFKKVPLLPQSYSIKLAVRLHDGREHIIPLQDVASFEVDGPLEEMGLHGDFKSLVYRSTPVMIPYEWILPDGTVAPVELGAGRSKPAPVELG